MEKSVRGDTADPGEDEANMFSYIVSTIFNENVTATMRTKMDKEMKITYRCNESEIDVKIGDLVWGPEALGFKKFFDSQDDGEDELDETMTQAFLSWKEHEKQT